jgi:Amt family ammonium transporter
MDQAWQAQRAWHRDRHGGAGLGTITPASGFVGPAAAVFIGALAGVICYFATQYVKRGLRIDDSLDVFPVHGVVATVAWCGIVTALIFAFVKKLVGLRVSIEEETEGLDLTQHDERGYSL